MKTIRITIIASLILFQLSSSFAQSNIDSLENIVSSLKKLPKADCLIELSWEYFYGNNAELCIKSANEALKISRENKGSLQEAKSLNILGIVYMIMNDIKKSRDYANQAIKVSKEKKIKEEEANAYNLLGLLNEQESDFSKSIEFHERALKIRREIDDQKGISKSLNNLASVYSVISQFEKAISYYEQAVVIKETLDDKNAVASTWLNIGNIYLAQAKYDLAIEHIQKALIVFEQVDFASGIAKSYNVYGLIYQNLKNYDKAIEYFEKSLEINKQIEYNVIGVSDALSNIGNVYAIMGDFEKSIEYYTESLKGREEVDDKPGIARSLNNIGLVYTRWGKFEEALSYYKQALEINTALDIHKEVANNLTAIAKNYHALKDIYNAIEYYNKSLDISLSIGLLDLSMSNYYDLAIINKNIENYLQAYIFYEKYATFKDSILTKDIYNITTEMQTKYETEKKEAQIKLQEADLIQAELENKRQRIFLFSSILIIILVLGMVIVVFRSLQQKSRDNKIIAAEKAKSEELLLNTLPIKVVNDLKEKGTSDPEGFENVSVYFSDVVGFTNLSNDLEPKVLINELNDIFTAFDDIMSEHHCERIKTIGDAYMAVCGMPEPNENHAQNLLNAALGIQHFLEERNKISQITWRIRIGINSGRVVGGIVGVRKYIYDVFGDTINTASRMESSSEPMRINISEATYDLVKDQYEIIERESQEVKGKGVMKMYFVEGPKVA